MKFNWLSFLEFILTLTAEALPQAAALIPSIASASPDHQATLNTTIGAALAATKAVA